MPARLCHSVPIVNACLCRGSPISGSPHRILYGLYRSQAGSSRHAPLVLPALAPIPPSSAKLLVLERLHDGRHPLPSLRIITVCTLCTLFSLHRIHILRSHYTEYRQGRLQLPPAIRIGRKKAPLVRVASLTPPCMFWEQQGMPS